MRPASTFSNIQLSNFRIEATSGNAVISWGEEVLYAMVEKNLKIFEKIS